MSIPVSAATNAYNAVSQIANNAGASAATAAPGAVSGDDFASMLKDAVNQVVETGRASDQVTMSAATGNANIVDVVTAVAESELALETMVAVRDRIISAYESIMRMPI
ncbi:MAG: flagellar hook-basal body complex protein FliE [Rhizobiales bacterium]|nr:flagellar hook-basal body complex protein FliE [Hyphomicrobiales bacterium]